MAPEECLSVNLPGRRQAETKDSNWEGVFMAVIFMFPTEQNSNEKKKKKKKTEGSLKQGCIAKKHLQSKADSTLFNKPTKEKTFRSVTTTFNTFPQRQGYIAQHHRSRKINDCNNRECFKEKKKSTSS